MTAEHLDCFLETKILMVTKQVSSPLRLRGTFTPSLPSLGPLVPALRPSELLPVEGHSLLNLTSKGGLVHEAARSKEPGYSWLCLLDIFQSILELSKQSFLRDLSKFRPCSIWPKMDGCFKTERLETPSAATLLPEFEHDIFCLWV